MTDSPSTRLRFRFQETGSNINVWGELLNDVLQLVDDSVAGLAEIALVSNYTLTSTNYVEDEARKAILSFTGTGAFTVTIPSVSKVYIVGNSCTGVLTITTGAGDTVDIDPDDVVLIVCDGSGVFTLGYGGLTLKQYIASAALTSTGTLPATVGNEGKALMVRSGVGTWDYPYTADIPDFASEVRRNTLIFTLIFGSA